MQLIKKNQLNLIFWVFSIIYLFAWTIGPLFVRHALTADFIEAATWGQYLTWGYDKNPWLPAFLTHVGLLLSTSGIGIYFIQSALIILGLWSVWKLTTALTNPIYGLIAALMLCATSWFTVDVQIYNDNYILMGLLPFASLLFFRALTTDKLIYWLTMSAILALATMAKYNAILLGVAIVIYLMLHPKRWQFLFSYKIYLALSVFLLIVLPNIIWLYQHDFITIIYAFQNKGGIQQKTWYEHLIKNVSCLREVFWYFLPAMVIASLSFARQSTSSLLISTNQALDKDHRLFLFIIGLGPVFLLLMLAIFLGFSLLSEWCMTFASFWGACFLALLKPSITKKSFHRFIVVIFFLSVIWPVGYLYISYKNDAGNFPGVEISDLATKIWHEHVHSSLSYVAGDRYTAGYVGLHSKDKPAVWMEWNHSFKNGIDLNDLRCKGAVFIQEVDKHTKLQNFSGYQFPDSVLKEFPQLIVLPPVKVKWARNHSKQEDPIFIIGLLRKSCKG